MNEERYYLRTGVVTARRLKTNRLWRTTNGELIDGKEGDWHVSDQSGGERVVKDRAFRETHRRLDGERWERVARVKARRAIRVELIESLEGPVKAEIGDWIVTDESGNTWPVPDSHFRASYIDATND